MMPVRRLSMVAFGAFAAALLSNGVAAQSLGPDYSQRSLPGAGGGDTVSGGGDLTGRDQRPVACIYQYSHRIPRPDIVDLVKNGYQAKTGKQKMTFQILGETIAACRVGNGWSPKRQDASLKFFTGRILADDAFYQGRDIGLTAPVVRALAGKLDPVIKAAYDSGRVDATQMAATMAQLKAAGLDPEPLQSEQREKLATLIAQALWGVHLQTEAAAAYKAG